MEFFILALIEWIAFEVFLKTNIFSGIHQLLFHIIFRFFADFYIMLVTPILWIWKSRKANWQGWGERKEKTEKYFKFVRKPDPFHDLLVERVMEERRKENVKTKGGFAYIGKNSLIVPGSKENYFQHKKDSKNIFIVKRGPLWM